MSIDLKNLKRPAPKPAPIVIDATPSVPAPMATPMPKAPPPPAPARPVSAPILPRGPISRTTWIKYGAAGLVILLVLGAGLHYIYANFWTKSPFGPTPGSAEAAEETAAASSATPAGDMSEAQIIEKVGAIFVLPSDETPALAKVSDPSALQNQSFFKNAKVGDIVLMYAKSQRAILYDPFINKVVEVAPITTQPASSTPPTVK